MPHSLDQGVDRPRGDRDLALGGAGLALLVDAHHDHRGAVLANDRHHPGEAALGAVTVLVVHGVHDRSAAEQLEAGLDHGRLGRVQHDRQGRAGGQPAQQLLHVLRAVAPDVVHAHVQQVRAVPGLRAGDLQALVPLLGQHRLAERLGTVGVGPLADRQVGGVLPEGDRRVQARHARLRPWPAGGQRAAADRLDHVPQVLRRGAAAAPHQGQPELLGELGVRCGQLLGRQGVEGAVPGQLWQAGVRHGGDRDPGVLGQVAQVLAHLGRAGSAVQSDRVDAQRLQSGQRGAYLAAEQHRAGRLDGDLDQHGQVLAGLAQRALEPDHGGLGLEQVLSRLDQQRVGPTLDHRRALHLVAVAQHGVRRVPQRGQLGARPDRADHEPLLVRRRPGVRRGTGDLGAGQRELVDPVTDVVLAERREVRAERVGLDRVDAHPEVLVVHRADDVRPSHVEDLVAALVPLEVVHARVGRLEHGAHGTVGDEHALVQEGAEQVGAAAHGGPSCRETRGGWGVQKSRLRATTSGQVPAC